MSEIADALSHPVSTMALTSGQASVRQGVVMWMVTVSIVTEQRFAGYFRRHKKTVEERVHAEAEGYEAGQSRSAHGMSVPMRSADTLTFSMHVHRQALIFCIRPNLLKFTQIYARSSHISASMYHLPRLRSRQDFMLHLHTCSSN